MENVKWANENVPRYDVTIPFIRNQAGPMDYTSGAMRNSNQGNFRAINNMPMSKGTRVHQLAMYVVFTVPIQMLSDNPTIYLKERECTDFITKIPTTFDETVPLDGKVAEYVVVARKKGDTWYVGAMTDWTPRELTIDFSFLDNGNFNAEIFSDGINADRDATDYKREVVDIKKGDKLKVKMMTGGGWAARLTPGPVDVRESSPINPKATTETKALLKNLKDLAKDHTLFGHPNATEYGHSWRGDKDRPVISKGYGFFSHIQILSDEFIFVCFLNKKNYCHEYF